MNIVLPLCECWLHVAELTYLGDILGPVLIGSRAAKWHVSSFREPNDWDLIATPLQTTLFINKVKESRAIFNNINLIHYPGGGLKLVGECIELSTSEKPISFDIELVSDKVDLRNMKSNVNLNKEENVKEDVNNSKDNIQDDINKIEFEKFNDIRPKISSLMILEMCQNIKDKIMFPLMSNFLCIVAPLKILEALKTSHINWPADFHKNIADLHLLRILLDYNKVSTIQPLCSPQRDEPIELMLKTRIKETEIIQGKPGAHINLNMSNEDFLENEDNLFVQKRVPHDDLHELVKYGDHPIYQGLKDDQSKAWIKKSLFEKLDYQTKLNCVKEEAMVIALERYLIPMISENQETSYNLALIRICTTLTKGWFRQFAIDNYPQLINLDKDLLSIARNVIKKFPIKLKKPVLLILDPETQAIFDSIRPYTETLSFSNKFLGYDPDFNITGVKITSPVNNNISVTAIITTLCEYNFSCNPSASWSASVVILPNLTSKYIFSLRIKANTSGSSWGVGEDIWKPIYIKAKSADDVASILEIPGLTGDLLFKYVLDFLNPTLTNNGETPLKHWVNELKSEGAIPIEPEQHLWYHAWNYELKSLFM
ncbi:19426_t:CDS:2 [Rhizophagus irregularis]|nr:19426_t:CDS:2 [Rhizophagus irregularis]